MQERAARAGPMGGYPLLQKILTESFSEFENFDESFFSKFGELTKQFCPILEKHVRLFSELGENPSLEKNIRQFSSIFGTFCTKAANLRSEKTEKTSYHT
jgi:hypothetical protein